MRIRIPALLVLALWLVPSVEAGMFGNKKRLPKPIKMVQIRPHDAKRLGHPMKIASKYGPEWGSANRIVYRPQQLHTGHYTEF
jgi:hypothetical protein